MGWVVSDERIGRAVRVTVIEVVRIAAFMAAVSGYVFLGTAVIGPFLFPGFTPSTTAVFIGTLQGAFIFHRILLWKEDVVRDS